MRSLDEALAKVVSSAGEAPAEEVTIQEACGRVVAKEICAPIPLPPWTHAAMDGYAVRADDVRSGGSLKLNELVVAGQVPSVSVEAGTATAIMTGAPMPEGADALVVLEESDGATEGQVTWTEDVAPGRHIRLAGEDVAQGDVVFERGATLQPAGVALLAALGVGSVRVSRRPRVGILVTGDELVEAGRELETGQIYGSNARALEAWVRSSGGEPVLHGTARDEASSLQAALTRAAEGSDLVLTTGGASVGARDMLAEVVGATGGSVDFWKVAMKPGKPVLWGSLAGGTPWLGLPGNPVSCMVAYLVLAHPWIRARLGDPSPELHRVRAIARSPLRSRPDRVHLLRVKVWEEEGALQCALAGSQGSAAMRSFAEANGIAHVQAGGTLDTGELAEVLLLPSGSGILWSGHR